MLCCWQASLEAAQGRCEELAAKERGLAREAALLRAASCNASVLGKEVAELTSSLALANAAVSDGA